MPTPDISDLSSIEPPSNWSLICRMLGLSWRYRWACTQVVLLQVMVVALGLGGLGLTGVVTWAELQLRPIQGPHMEVESIRFANLEEFFALSAPIAFGLVGAFVQGRVVVWLDRFTGDSG